MLLYRERLRVPVSWWLAGAGCVLILGTTLAAGLSVAVGVAIYLGMGALLAIAFLTWGSVMVRVTRSEVTAGPAKLAVDQIDEVSAMDATQTRALRGPSADVAAYLLVRPYLAESVYVAITGRPADRPYFLIASRRPAQLAAAIDTARSQAVSSALPPVPANGWAVGASPAMPPAGLTAAQLPACDDVESGDHAADTDAI